jgi:CO/xanthine dehydrogenase Mo-binding subunit
VSDLVGAPLKTIRVISGDTGRAPAGSGTFASREITIAGNAVMAAASTVRDKMARIAAHMIECDPADVRFEDGYTHVVGVKDMKVSLRQIAAAAYSQTESVLPPGEGCGIESIEYYDTPTAAQWMPALERRRPELAERGRSGSAGEAAGDRRLYPTNALDQPASCETGRPISGGHVV